jgi:putative ABC transport system substrate-binding protein
MVNARKPTLPSPPEGKDRAILPSHREEQMSFRRREFIVGLGGTAAAWPLAAGAQQRALPVTGYLSGRTADFDSPLLVSFRRGLADVGYAEGRNVAIEFRFADGRYDRLSAISH